MKRCYKCKILKPHTDFWRKSRNLDGLQAACKTCMSTENKEWTKKNRERHRERLKIWRENNPDRSNAIGKQQRERWHDKQRARQAAGKALLNGTITKPTACTRCHHIPPPHCLHGHHEDYSKPLEVIWLCARCHGALHTHPFP